MELPILKGKLKFKEGRSKVSENDPDCALCANYVYISFRLFIPSINLFIMVYGDTIGIIN